MARPNTLRQPTKRVEAEEWLVTLLSEGSTAVTVIRELAYKLGYSSATLSRAKSNLGIQSFKRIVWYWTKDTDRIIAPPPISTPRPLTDQDVDARVNKKIAEIAKFDADDNRPRTQKEVEQQAEDEFNDAFSEVKFGKQEPKRFKTILQSVTEWAREYDMETLPSFADDQIHTFVLNGLNHLMERSTEGECEILREFLPEPTELTLEEVDAQLDKLKQADVAGFGLSEEDEKIKDALERRRAQLEPF
jgi:uncharacterized protein YqeY